MGHDPLRRYKIECNPNLHFHSHPPPTIPSSVLQVSYSLLLTSFFWVPPSNPLCIARLLSKNKKSCRRSEGRVVLNCSKRGSREFYLKKTKRFICEPGKLPIFLGFHGSGSVLPILGLSGFVDVPDRMINQFPIGSIEPVDPVRF